jgi:hypothetical protein
MQATLDIDDDVFRAIETLSRRESKPAGKLLSELARAALGAAAKQPSKAGETKAFGGFTPFPKRGGGVTDELINKIREGDCY